MTDVNKKIDEWENRGMKETGMETDGMWDFNTNPVFEGVFVEKRENVGENGSNIYVCESSEDNNRYGIWGSAILDTRLSNIKAGEEVGIAYIGIKKGKSGRNYKDFRVFHSGAEEANQENTDEVNTDDIPF
jgi:hypothetical protein